MLKSPKEIFKAIDDEEILLDICLHRRIPGSSDDGKALSKTQIIDELTEDVIAVGYRKFFLAINLKLLKVIATECGVEEKKTKNSIAKKLLDIFSQNPKDSFKKLSTETKMSILEDLGEDIPDNKSEYNDRLQLIAESYGMEHCLSSFEVNKLCTIAESCGLKLRNNKSIEVVLDAILRLENADKKPKKKKEKSEEKLSRFKPEIKLGVSKTDLNGHYKRAELVEYCKKHDLRYIGKKTELVNNISAFLEGKPVKSIHKRKTDKKSSDKSEEESEPQSKKSKTESSPTTTTTSSSSNQPTKDKEETATSKSPKGKTKK